MNTTELVRAAGGFEPTVGFLERFEALVRADERESCAKVCDVEILEDAYSTALINSYAEEIRAKGQK